MKQLVTLRKTTAWSLPLILALAISTPALAAPGDSGPMGMVDQIVHTAWTWWTDAVDALGYGHVIGAEEGTSTSSGTGSGDDDDGGTGTTRDPVGGGDPY